MKTKELELQGARRIVDAWVKCFPVGDAELDAQAERDRIALELEAQMLVNESVNHHETLRAYFIRSGISVSERKLVKARKSWKNSTKAFLALLVSVIVLILTLLYFSADHSWIDPESVLTWGILAILFVLALYPAGALKDLDSDRCGHHHHH